MSNIHRVKAGEGTRERNQHALFIAAARARAGVPRLELLQLCLAGGRRGGGPGLVGLETSQAFHERVAQAFALILERRQSTRDDLLVVTHGLVCRAILSLHVRCAEGLAAPLAFGNTSVTLLEDVPPHLATLVACCAHLPRDSRALGQV